MTLEPITNKDAKCYFKKHSAYRGDFDIAIAAKEGNTIHGVIAVIADGVEFRLGHVSTDGNAQVGSLLYGAAWRTAKALGYKRVWI
jgi:hypothetical protein